jgi:hypothetical protein
LEPRSSALEAFHSAFPAFRRFPLAAPLDRAYIASIDNAPTRRRQMITALFTMVTVAVFVAVVADVAAAVSRRTFA